MICSNFFTSLHIDETAVMSRFGGSCAIFEKYLKRFPNDPSWNSLAEAVQKDDFSGIETAAHTLKGVSANFGFHGLTQACSDLVSAVRTNAYDRIPEAFSRAKTEYETITATILSLQ